MQKTIPLIKFVFFLGMVCCSCNQNNQENAEQKADETQTKIQSIEEENKKLKEALYRTLAEKETLHRTLPERVVDTKMADLKYACDYIRVGIEMFDSIITICNKYPEELMHQQITKEDFEYLKLLIRKSDELEEEVEKRFSRAETRECPNYKRANRKWSFYQKLLSNEMRERLQKSPRKNIVTTEYGKVGEPSTTFNRTENTSSNGRYPQTSQRLLSTSEISGMSKQDLKIMRNEIFARHGYIFKTPEMKSYFKTQSWYHGQYDDVTSMLSSIEKQNVELIKKYE